MNLLAYWSILTFQKSQLLTKILCIQTQPPLETRGCYGIKLHDQVDIAQVLTGGTNFHSCAGEQVGRPVCVCGCFFFPPSYIGGSRTPISFALIGECALRVDWWPCSHWRAGCLSQNKKFFPFFFVFLSPPHLPLLHKMEACGNCVAQGHGSLVQMSWFSPVRRL